jgi:hypothetical protein
MKIYAKAAIASSVLLIAGTGTALGLTLASHTAVLPGATVSKTVSTQRATAEPAAMSAAKPAAMPTPRPTAKPAALAIFTASGFSGVKPEWIAFSGDAGNVVTSITWSTWTSVRATGSGTSNIQGCVPNCATGTETPVAATITLYDPVNGKFTAVLEQRDGTETTSWPQSAAPSNPIVAVPSPTAAGDGLPVGVWFPAGHLNIACGPPTASTNGLNTSYVEAGNNWIIDNDDPASSPCNS